MNSKEGSPDEEGTETFLIHFFPFLCLLKEGSPDEEGTETKLFHFYQPS